MPVLLSNVSKRGHERILVRNFESQLLGHFLVLLIVKKKSEDVFYLRFEPGVDIMAQISGFIFSPLNPVLNLLSGACKL